MMRRALVIAWKELLQLRRDRLTAAMMVALPVIQLLLFGYAINTDVRHIPTVVFDQDRSAESRDFARRLEATGYYDIRGNVSSYDEIDRSLLSGHAHAALVVPPGYASHLVRGTRAELQLVVDGSDPQTVGSALSTASSLAAVRSAEVRAMRLAKTDQGIQLEPSVRYNPEQRTALNIVPGLIGVILTMTMVMLTSMALARERERGTLEQLIVSPVQPSEIVVGKILPYIAMGYVQMTLILMLGWVVFGVAVVGSVPLLFLLAFLFIAANLAIGLFFSTMAKTQQQAMQMSFFFLLPNILLSGFMFPHEAMPGPARLLSQALPLTHFLRIVRGIVLKGAHFQDVALEVVWLAGILGVLVTLSSLRFRKKLV
jgi:ABC-2 type transport system permease protein